MGFVPSPWPGLAAGTWAQGCDRTVLPGNVTAAGSNHSSDQAKTGIGNLRELRKVSRRCQERCLCCQLQEGGTDVVGTACQGNLGEPCSSGSWMGQDRRSFWVDSGGGAGLRFVNTWKWWRSLQVTPPSNRAGAELQCRCPSGSQCSLPGQGTAQD